jgi:hypothetical protein
LFTRATAFAGNGPDAGTGAAAFVCDDDGLFAAIDGIEAAVSPTASAIAAAQCVNVM